MDRPKYFDGGFTEFVATSVATIDGNFLMPLFQADTCLAPVSEIG